MAVNYLSDSSGNTIAIQISIEDWKRIKDKYPDIDELDGPLPEWQKQLIDSRLEAIANNPDRLRPIDELLNDLDKED